MHEGPAVAVMPQGPEGPWSGPELFSAEPRCWCGELIKSHRISYRRGKK